MSVSRQKFFVQVFLIVSLQLMLSTYTILKFRKNANLAKHVNHDFAICLFLIIKYSSDYLRSRVLTFPLNLIISCALSLLMGVWAYHHTAKLSLESLMIVYGVIAICCVAAILWACHTDAELDHYGLIGFSMLITCPVITAIMRFIVYFYPPVFELIAVGACTAGFTMFCAQQLQKLMRYTDDEINSKGPFGVATLIFFFIDFMLFLPSVLLS